MVKNLPVNAGDWGLIPGSERSPGEGNDNLLQCSCLGNPMGRGTWRATVHGVTKELDVPQQLDNCNPYYLRSDCILWEIWGEYEKSKQEIKTLQLYQSIYHCQLTEFWGIYLRYDYGFIHSLEPTIFMVLYHFSSVINIFKLYLFTH